VLIALLPDLLEQFADGGLVVVPENDFGHNPNIWNISFWRIEYLILGA